jgi:hypothetical protein
MLDAASIERVRAWLALGGGGAAWLTGAPGSGMTTMVTRLAADMGLETIWLTAASPKSRAFLKDVCRNPVAVTGKRKVLILDELDVMLGNETAMVDVSFVIKNATAVPVVCILKATRAARENELRKKASLVIDFPVPTPQAMAALATRVAAEEGLDATEDDILRMCHQAPPGDVRHVLQTMRCRAATMRTAALQTCDAVHEVFLSARTIDQALVHFWGESGAVSSGVFEAYHQSTQDIHQAALFADYASCADLVDDNMHGTHSWHLMDIYGCLTTASAAVLLPKSKVTLSKYGVSWNLEYARCTKTKQLRRVELARLEAGLPTLGYEGASVLRGMLQTLLSSRADLVEVCKGAGLDADNVLNIMRLWPQVYTQYKLSTHARVKRWLASV